MGKLSNESTVAIVGAGVAGLRCAIELQERGLKPIIFEASDRVGGRIKTDQFHEFKLDRGFQVLLTAYDECRSVLDYDELDLGCFEPGAIVWTGSKFAQITDPWRRPASFFRSARSPIGSLNDKLKIANLRQRLTRKSNEEIYATSKDEPTFAYLHELGYSEGFINSFLRPFYGGIFLEPDLRTSRIMFDFVFKMFAQGYAALPRGGMERIPLQLASKLPKNAIRFNAPVEKLKGHTITLEDGSKVFPDHTVVATDMSAAASLSGNATIDRGWNRTSCLYFSTERSPFKKPCIALNGSGLGKITNIAVPSDAAAGYSSSDASLICVSTEGAGSLAEIESELKTWFGPNASAFRFLKRYDILQALPRQQPGDNGYGKHPSRLGPNLWICGDHRFSASIEGAMASGRHVAEAICQELGK